ncbi:MAG TPA: DUF3892 domain-containing protein [Spirochaetia bacterium]|nr:DUF3892 domain-containing protein [Spirochaetia bacterium]
MAKWADYLISAVRYIDTQNGRHISHLRVHPDSDSAVGTATIWTKDQVVTSINGGRSFKTIYKNQDGSWKQGEDVRVVVIEGHSYLRTDANRTKADNLGELPEF